MLHQAKLDLNTRALNVSVGFLPELLTIINPTPYVIRAHMSGELSSVGDFIVQAGTTMSVPTNARQWAFELIVSGIEPEAIAPALIYFTQDEIAPSVLAIGVAEVTYKKAIDAMETTDETVYAITGSTWQSLDDDIYKIELECATGKLIVGFSSRVHSTVGRFVFGIFDSLTMGTYIFHKNRGLDNLDATFLGFVDLVTPGLRTLYLRARSPDGTSYIKPMSEQDYRSLMGWGF